MNGIHVSFCYELKSTMTSGGIYTSVISKYLLKFGLYHLYFRLPLVEQSHQLHHCAQV